MKAEIVHAKGQGPLAVAIDRTPEPYESTTAPLGEHGAVDNERMINIGGQIMPVKVAVRAGLLNLPGEGGAPVNAAPDQPQGQPTQPSSSSLALNPEGNKQEEAKPPQDPNRVEGESLGDEAEALLDQAVQGAGGQEVMAAVNAAATGQELSQETINQVAANMGIEPAEAAQLHGQIKAAFEAQALGALKEMGLDQEAVLWAFENEPELFEDAVRRHTFDRTTEGYRELGRRYVEKLDQINPQAVVDALPKELNPRIVPSPGGKSSIVVIKTPQGEMSWRSAVMLGLVDSVAWV